MKPYCKFIIPLQACALLIILSACTTLSYYGQSINGQLEILRKQQPITILLENGKLDLPLRDRLRNILSLREFASRDLQLPDNNSYRSYADLGRRYVVWNVIATPEFSLHPVESCFPIAGCLPYRGYFSEQDAHRFARQLQDAGHDVFVGGVTAYSTLGWFDDPVLNTMLYRNNPELARVIFHELAHQKIYIRDDTDYNEALADTVARIGVRRWLEFTGADDERLQFEQQLERQRQFINLVQEYKQRLEILYMTNTPSDDKRRSKAAILAAMHEDYRLLQSGWGDHDDYKNWFAGGLNNARFATILTYQNLVPDFLMLFNALNGDISRFYDRVAYIGTCPKRLRRDLLRQEPQQWDCPDQ